MSWPLAFRNDSGEAIPQYAIMRVTGMVTVNSRSILTVAKPNTFGSQYSHVVNGFVEVASGAYGSCTANFPAKIKYNGTPAAGEVWGPRSGSWSLEDNTGGFVCLGNGIFVPAPYLSGYGKFDSSVTQGATGTVSVWWGADNGTDGSDTGQNLSGVLAVGNSFTTSDFVNFYWDNGVWSAYARKC